MQIRKVVKSEGALGVGVGRGGGEGGGGREGWREGEGDKQTHTAMVFSRRE